MIELCKFRLINLNNIVQFKVINWFSYKSEYQRKNEVPFFFVIHNIRKCDFWLSVMMEEGSSLKMDKLFYFKAPTENFTFISLFLSFKHPRNPLELICYHYFKPRHIIYSVNLLFLKLVSIIYIFFKNFNGGNHFSWTFFHNKEFSFVFNLKKKKIMWLPSHLLK